MEKTPEITPFQFYTILFLSRVFAMVTYVAGFRSQLTTTDEVIMTLVMGVFLLVTAIPVALFNRKGNRLSVIDRASEVSAVFSKILCVIYFAGTLYFGIVTAVRFGIFTGSVMFPDINITFFVFIMIAASAFIAGKGIEAMGRSAVIILIPVFFALVFVFVTQTEKFDFLNFTSAFSDGVRDIFSSGAYTGARTGEVAFVLLMTPYVKGQKSSHLYRWLAVVVLIIVITEIFISGVLGNYAGTQLFSMYSMSVLAQFGFIERLDSLITCMWLLCAGVKLSVTVFLCASLMTSFFGKRKQILYIAVSSLLIFAGTLPLSGSLLTFASLIRSPFTVIFYLLCVCVIPVVVMISEKLKVRAKLETI